MRPHYVDAIGQKTRRPRLTLAVWIIVAIAIVAAVVWLLTD
jgi:hypothetical protein